MSTREEIEATFTWLGMFMSNIFYSGELDDEECAEVEARGLEHWKLNAYNRGWREMRDCFQDDAKGGFLDEPNFRKYL